MQSAFGAGLFLSVEMHKSAQRSPKHLSQTIPQSPTAAIEKDYKQIEKSGCTMR